MEVLQAIDNMKFSLEHVTSEDELREILSDRLTGLRQEFRSHRSLFSAGEISILKSLAGVLHHLRAFSELKEELSDVGSLKEYEDILGRLTHTKAALGDVPVARRVVKEIRGLNEKFPAIRERDEANRQFRLSGRVRDLEENPPRCPGNHPMVVRKGPQVYFWGCSRYPLCDKTARLTTEQRRLLNV